MNDHTRCKLYSITEGKPVAANCKYCRSGKRSMKKQQGTGMHSVKSRDRFPLRLYGVQQGYLAAYVVRRLLLIVHSSTPCSVFLSRSKTVDCCSTACRKLRPWHWISIWTTRDSSISGWRSLSIARIHTAKPQNQSERGTSLTAKRGRPEIESPRG